mmetsp:Transcript_32863/g.98298  ORF Transcript_32863/g.98298 Transcript_32863/m.98298 type:complete len:242 (-) Transcript_32863:908-1633(-)
MTRASAASATTGSAELWREGDRSPSLWLPRPAASKVARAGVAREGDHVADVWDAGDVADEPLEAESVARVGDRPVPAEVDVPPVVLRVEPRLLHLAQQHRQPLLALAAADELADTGHEQVHRRNRLAVVVVSHVEGLDGLGVVVDEDGAAEGDLGEPPLVLGGEVRPKLDARVLPLGRVLCDLCAQQLDRLRVRDAREGVFHHHLEPRAQRLLKRLASLLLALHLVVLEEGQVLAALGQHM